MLSCAGNVYLKTPNLDKLAQQGVRFERAYAANPVCMPSRFSMQTGLYPSAIEVRHNGSSYNKVRNTLIRENALGNLFKNAGYDTYYGGKIHLPGGADGIETFGYELITHDERDQLAVEMANLLRNRKQEQKPFFCFVSFINPHDICYDAIRFFQPESKLAKNTPRELDDVAGIPDNISEQEFWNKVCPPLSANFDVTKNQPEAIDLLLNQRKFRREARDNWGIKNWRLHRWKYHRLTEHVDSQIGQVLKALDDSGLAESTIVVFTSDHGDMDSAHRMEHKTVFYEEASRIPFIFAGPNIIKGKVDTINLVNNGVDLLPTLCDLAGIGIPEGLHGRSLKRILHNENLEIENQYIFVENEIGYLVSDGRYKYAVYNSGERNELLIDLRLDPGEMNNLIGDEDYKSVHQTLKDALLHNIIMRRDKMIRHYGETKSAYRELAEIIGILKKL
jgi:choline-sulfatase